MSGLARCSSACLSEFLSGVLSGDLPLEDAADDLAALGIRSVSSAAAAGYLGVGSDDLAVRFGGGFTVVVSFQTGRS